MTNHAIGLNYDTYPWVCQTSYQVIGLEAAGKIDEIGSNVTEFNKGDNIATRQFLSELRTTKNYSPKLL